MKRSYVRIFCGAQAAGALCCVGAYFIQDPLLWLVSLLLLLPGSLPAWLQLFGGPYPYAGNNWSLLTLGLTAVAANVFLFGLTASLLRLRGKAN